MQQEDNSGSDVESEADVSTLNQQKVESDGENESDTVQAESHSDNNASGSEKAESDAENDSDAEQQNITSDQEAKSSDGKLNFKQNG